MRGNGKIDHGRVAKKNPRADISPKTSVLCRMRPMGRDEWGGPGHAAMGMSLITLLRHEETSLGLKF